MHRRAQDELILEDIDGNEYRVLDPSRLSLRRNPNDMDSESIRRHEYDRGSDRIEAMYDSGRDIERRHIVPNREGIPENAPPSRDQMFIRDGNAEILRLVTRGRMSDDIDDEPQLNQPQRPFTIQNESIQEEQEGKEVIMRRFIEDQRNGGSEKDTEKKDEDEEDEELLRRVIDIPDRGLSTAQVNRLTTLQRDLLLTRFLVEEHRRTLSQTQIEDTQSLPGVVTMATQTDVEAGTQTDSMQISKRRSKSDNDDSLSDSEDIDRKRIRRGRRVQRIREERQEGQRRSTSRCEIKSPIIEEPEGGVETSNGHDETGVKPPANGFTETKASMLRQAATRSKLGQDDDFDLHPLERSYERRPHLNHGLYKVRSVSEQDIHSISRHRENVLKSLQVTPVRQVNIVNNVSVEHVLYKDPEREQPKSSEAITSGSTENEKNSSEQKEKSDSPRSPTKTSRLTSKPLARQRDPLQRAASREDEATPRYMEWYKKKREEREQQRKQQEVEDKKKVLKKPRAKSTKKETNDTKNVESSTENIEERETSKSEESPTKRPIANGVPHKNEEDRDSGIAMTNMAPSNSLNMSHKNHQALEKKSIFTIAYDDMETKQLRIDTASPP